MRRNRKISQIRTQFGFFWKKNNRFFEKKFDFFFKIGKCLKIAVNCVSIDTIFFPIKMRFCKKSEIFSLSKI